MEHTRQSPCLNLIQHSLRQCIHRLLMHVMRQNDTTPTIQLVIELVHTVGNQTGVIVLVILRVDAAADNMVPEIPQSTQRDIISGKIWRPHVGRLNADNLLQRILELGHLRHDPVVVERGEVRMAPTASMVSINHTT